MKYKIILVLSIIVIMGVAGCRTATLFNVERAPITVVGKDYSLQDIEKAIIRAGVALGWQMKSIAPGHMLGTLYLRDHMAQVDITYNRSSYNIVYNDSSNLRYNGTIIHRNYNSWVQNLSNGIRVQISAI